MWYDTIKMYYDNKHPRYTNDSLKVFVQAKMITPEEYFLITGIVYVI